MVLYSKNRFRKTSLFLVIVLMTTAGLFGQNADWLLDNAYNNLTWAEFVKKAEATYDLQFFFDENITEVIELKPIINPILLADYLQQQLSEKGINVSYGGEGAIFLHVSKNIQTNLLMLVLLIMVELELVLQKERLKWKMPLT